MAIPEKKIYTAEEYFQMIPETKEHIELIDGEIISQAAPSITHQKIAGNIYVKMVNYINRKGGSCTPLMSPVDVKLDDSIVVQPDVLVVCDPNKISDDKRCYGAPDLVVEVISTNRSYDLVRKLGIYKDAGVREYWIVDPKAERVLVYLFENDSFPNMYTFDQPIPVGICGGELTITIEDML